jgi:hypothetical protein
MGIKVLYLQKMKGGQKQKDPLKGASFSQVSEEHLR